MNNGIKAIVMDFDGVILESVDVKTEAFRELFSRYTSRVDDIVNYHLANNGVSRFVKFKHMWESFLGRQYSDTVEKMLGEEFSGIVFKKILKCPFVRGAEEFLETFSGKMPIYVASAAPSEELARIVKERMLGRYFSGVYGTPHKKTDVIKHAIEEGGIDPRQVVYIGDSAEDLKAAMSAGVLFIGRRNKEDLDNSGVAVYDDLGQIKESLLRAAQTDLAKHLYIDQYLKLIDRLTARYHSTVWFSTFTAAKNRYASGLFIDLYNFTLYGKSGVKIRSGFPWIRFFLISFLRIARALLRIGAARLLFFGRMKKRPKEDTCLIWTGFYPSSVTSKGTYSDAFFGNLPEYLDRSGKRPILVGSTFSGGYFPVMLKLRRIKDRIALPYEYFLSFLDPFRAFIHVWRHRIRLDDKIYLMGKDVSRLFGFYLDRDVSDNSLEHLLSFYSAKNLVRRIKAEAFTVIYENNPWQAMTLEAVKSFSPATRTTGYQHTVVTLGRPGLMFGEREKRFAPLPNKIITNGDATKNILERISGLPPDKLVAGCALRFDIKNGNSDGRGKRPGKIRTVLVALAALYQSAKLLNIVYGALKKTPEYNVIIRPHPGLPVARMKKNLDFSLEGMPVHFKISNSSITDDLGQADIMIYDESSLCLHALYSGIPLVYINTDPIINVDPLFECGYLKEKVEDSSQLIPVIERFSKKDPKSFEEERRMARNYVESYLKPVSEDGMEVFI